MRRNTLKFDPSSIYWVSIIISLLRFQIVYLAVWNVHNIHNIIAFAIYVVDPLPSLYHYILSSKFHVTNGKLKKIRRSWIMSKMSAIHIELLKKITIWRFFLGWNNPRFSSFPPIGVHFCLRVFHLSAIFYCLCFAFYIFVCSFLQKAWCIFKPMCCHLSLL